MVATLSCSDLKIYAVGGAVRDELLGLPVKDRDWVVVGATPEEMLARGFRAVGRDFPVFLHPDSHEEYALARTERKTAPGYKGFMFHADPQVTLEQDLARRDLTINAIAKSADGGFVDPHGGRRDLEAKVLRHVSPAFVEDPVRILRLARFAARFADFTIADETLQLMSAMVSSGEADHLVAERVWQELARGLMAVRPSRMFETLRSCGALARTLPELDALWGVPQRADHHPEVDTGRHVMLVIDAAAEMGLPLAARFAALVHDLGKAKTPARVLPQHIGHEAATTPLVAELCLRLRVPADCRDLALLVARYHTDIHRGEELRPETVLKLVERCDAFRRPERFEELLQACEADFRGRLGFSQRDYPQHGYWQKVANAARAVDSGAIAARCREPAMIAEQVRAARVNAIKESRQ